MGTKQTEKYAEAAGQIAPYDPQARAGALAEYMSSVHIYRIDELPRIELYLDQVITLVCDELAFMCLPDEQTLTGSMVNNYVKEGLMTPVKGKKYTRQQIMQLLCVYHLKQTLRLNDVKALTGRDDVDFAACYEHLLADKKRMREAIPPLLTAQLPETPDDPEERLCTCLALSEIANYLRRLCESMIDDIPQQTEGD